MRRDRRTHPALRAVCPSPTSYADAQSGQFFPIQFSCFFFIKCPLFLPCLSLPGKPQPLISPHSHVASIRASVRTPHSQALSQVGAQPLLLHPRAQHRPFPTSSEPSAPSLPLPGPGAGWSGEKEEEEGGQHVLQSFTEQDDNICCFARMC